MKKITAIVRPSILEDLKDALIAINITGITISQVMGCGNQHGWKEYHRGEEITLNVLPKMMIELVVADSKEEVVIKTIIKFAKTGEPGDGKIFVSNVERIIRIRTEEEGEAAI